ncbi:uncharacterized protein DS421_4g127150 [Arachis hypogaea]|nr:uncharacterized protein DS421_4g127150 [Arachis hypogaea]
MSSSKQHASCVLMWLRHVSPMQQHATCVSSVSMQETGPTPKTGVIYGEGWCRKQGFENRTGPASPTGLTVNRQ